MEEYVDEAEDVALHNGFGESYDHEEANLEAFREIAFLKGMEEGKEKGLQQGIQQGIQQGQSQSKLTIAKNLLKLNISIEDIATGLEVEEIKKL